MEEKERYEYYKGTTEIFDNELDDIVEDVVDILNTQDYNKRELLKVKQNQGQQLAELKKQLEEKDNKIKDLEEENKQLKQSQKQLAISELEKAKNCCEKYADELYDNLVDVVLPTDIDKPKRAAMKYLYLVSEVIDNQIKKLKGEE